MDTTICPGVAYFKLKHPNARMPEFKTKDSACCDLYLPENVYVLSDSTTVVKLGLIAIPPSGWHWEIYLRSSTPLKYKGLILANHVGIIDSDYVGEQDELGLVLTNISNRSIFIAKGSRIAQMCLRQNVRPVILQSISELNVENRGGFGSTDSQKIEGV